MSSLTWVLLIIWALITFASPGFANTKVPEIPEPLRKVLAGVIIAVIAAIVFFLVGLAGVMTYNDLYGGL